MTIRCQKCGHENSEHSISGHCEKCEAVLLPSPDKSPEQKKRIDMGEIPNSVKFLAVLYLFLGVGWIFVSYFGIWKMRKWGLSVSILMSAFYVFVFFGVIFQFLTQTVDFIDFLNALVIASALPVTTFYVWKNHYIKRFK